MFIKDLYQDILGSAGGLRLNFMIYVNLFKNNSLLRTLVFLKNFLFYGRIINSIKRQKKINKNLYFPKSIVIEPTYDCNLDCGQCYIKKEKKTMTEDLFDKIITDAEKTGIYRFEIMGGEPLMPEVRKEILPVIKKHKNSYFTICTNCHYFDDEIIKDFKPLKNLTFVLSSEGNKKFTDKRRGKGTFDKFDNALKKLKREKMAYALSLTINDKTWKEQLSEEVLDHYTKNGGFVLYVHFIVDNKIKDDLQADIDKVKYLKHLQYINKKYNLWMLDGIYGKMTNSGIIPRDYFQVCIDPSGNVRPFRFYNKPLIGSLKDQKLRSILAAPELTKVKNEKRIESNNYLNSFIDALKPLKFNVYSYSRKADHK